LGTILLGHGLLLGTLRGKISILEVYSKKEGFPTRVIIPARSKGFNYYSWIKHIRKLGIFTGLMEAGKSRRIVEDR